MRSNAKDIFFKIHKEDQKTRLKKENSRIFFAIYSRKEEDVARNNTFSFRLTANNSAVDTGATDIRYRIGITRYTLGRLMGFSISFLAECIPYGGAR